MLIGHLPDLRETQSGKDLIAIGKAEGKAEGLVKVLEIRFGKITASLKKQILQVVSDEELNRLYERALAISKLAEFKVQAT